MKCRTTYCQLNALNTISAVLAEIEVCIVTDPSRTLPYFYCFFSVDRRASTTLVDLSAQKNAMPTHMASPREMFSACDSKF